MKKVSLILMVFMLTGLTTFSQKAETKNEDSRTSQATLYNDFYGGYGALSIFYFTGRMKHKSEYPTESGGYSVDGINYSNKKFTEPQSVGNFYIGYARSLNRVVSVGFKFGYQEFHYRGTAQHSENGTNAFVPITATDQLISGIAKVTFCYLNASSVRLYSGFGLGLTIDFGKATIDGQEFTERKLWPGGELTLMGLRFGRTFGGFLEFGFGSYGILNAGLSYKFAD